MQNKTPVRNRKLGSRVATVLTTHSDHTQPAPRSDLGRRLLSLRSRALASGVKLLNEDEVLEEVARRRGELV